MKVCQCQCGLLYSNRSKRCLQVGAKSRREIDPSPFQLPILPALPSPQVFVPVSTTTHDTRATCLFPRAWSAFRSANRQEPQKQLSYSACRPATKMGDRVHGRWIETYRSVISCVVRSIIYQQQFSCKEQKKLRTNSSSFIAAALLRNEKKKKHVPRTYDIIRFRLIL